MIRVIERRVTPEHRWHHCRTLHELNTRWRRVLSKTQGEERTPIDFHGWDPAECVEAGDVVTYVELCDSAADSEPSRTEEQPARSLGDSIWANPLLRLKRLWTESSSSQRLVALIIVGLVLFHSTGAMIYKLRYPEISLLDAFNVATVLIFDGYSNMFAQLKLPFPIPLWMLLFSLLMTMSGAIGDRNDLCVPDRASAFSPGALSPQSGKSSERESRSGSWFGTTGDLCCLDASRSQASGRRR